MPTPKEMEHGRRQLRRLESLTDVIFALAIWRIFMLLPRPGEGDRSFSTILEMYRGDAAVLAIVLIGFVLMIVYWIQNNAVFGALERTDNRHTVLSILQICSVLLFLYSVRLGVEFDGTLGAMVFESIAALLMGGLGLASWLYAATDRRLISDAVTDEDARHLTARLLPSPVTAALTVGIAFLGSLWWTLSWFILGAVVGRLAKKWVRKPTP
jgi:uncharacterized membrane protein